MSDYKFHKNTDHVWLIFLSSNLLSCFNCHWIIYQPREKPTAITFYLKITYFTIVPKAKFAPLQASDEIEKILLRAHL